ncbi:hypothetical protein [Seonamhaeicola sp. ML3]|uniref:hypothetical protein n=1 Tax=Seonamhaeicola sp. ML3 TaxID=2937786 RepID=UPI00200CBB4D|nr:hypothetical protein [Seonamhaeicola sp. ML3]
MESKITLTKRNSLEELNELFTKGTPLSGIKITYVEPNDIKTYHKPFFNVLTSNEHIVIANQYFNGEPFLRGQFEFMQVLLPEKRLKSLNRFYRVLNGILNGYHICTKAKKDCLVALANEIYYHYTPIHHVFKLTEERLESFKKIEDIIDKIIEKPSVFKGRVKCLPILWNPDYDLTPYQKSDLTNKDGGKTILNKNLQLLINAYRDGMTQEELEKKVPLSLSTIKRRWTSILQNHSNEKDNLKAA